MKHIRGTINWGIIGAGDVCEVKSGPAFNMVPNSRLIAVMRRNKEKAADYAMRHHVPKFYNDAHLLIHDPEINAIYVATPPAYHEEYAIAAIRAGKPVYIEKPVTLTAEGCERIIQESITYKIPVSVAHYRRRLPLFLKVKTMVGEGVIGKIHLITIRLLQSPSKQTDNGSEKNWRVDPVISGGGLFHDLAPHQLDFIYWLFGAPVSMSGHSFNQGKCYDAPDVTHLQVFFKEDIYLEGLWLFNVNEKNSEDRCELFGEKGKISFSFFRNPVIEMQTDRGIKKLEIPYPQHVQQPMIAEVVRFFRNECPNPCSPEEALWTMRMMDSPR